jgi:hypothetical protein
MGTKAKFYGPAFAGLETNAKRRPDRCAGTRAPRATHNDTLMATLGMANCGSVAGDSVLKMYVSVPILEVERAPKELKAFKRVRLDGGTDQLYVDRWPAPAG